MEEWNIGMMGKEIECLKNPLFHHSSIPIYLLGDLCMVCGKK